MATKTDRNDLDASRQSSSPAGTEREPKDGVGRRGFLKLAGFGISGAVVGGCNQAPVENAIPYLIQPEDMIPGRALYYASTCQACPAACGLLAKTIDGRPIKLEGNPEHPLSQGGLCAVGQASLLGLYDSLRLGKPLKQDREASWEDVDDEIRQILERIRSQGGRVRFLTPTMVSPTLRRIVERFLAGFADGRLVEFDLLSSSAILDAHQRTHGVRLLPRYRFEKASVIVGFDADFLATWISPVEFAGGYRRGRQLKGAESDNFSYHAQFEARMSLTGANADRRIVISPDSLAANLAHLLHLLAPKAGWRPTPTPTNRPDLDTVFLSELADRLWQARGKSLIVCGAQDLRSQVLCNALNQVLGNYGNTIDIEAPSRQLQGSDQALLTLAEEMKDGAVDALLIAGMNPLHGLPRWAEDISRVGLVVDFAERRDETAQRATFVCPVPHPLESWSDAAPVEGLASLSQPAIRPMRDSRPLIESLSAWMGDSRSSLEILKEHWRTHVFPRASAQLSFSGFWDQTLHDGFARLNRQDVPAATFDANSLSSIASSPATGPEGGLKLVAYPKVGMLDGRTAYNAWCQELPDPISKVTWGNYACLSPATAERLHLREGDVVRVSSPPGGVELPVMVQPGQHDEIVAVALGYGAEASRRFSSVGPQWIEARPSVQEDGRVGHNVAPLLTFEGGLLQLSGRLVEIRATGRASALARTQDYDELEVPERLRAGRSEPRPIVLETTLAALQAGKPLHHSKHLSPELWSEDHSFPKHHWGLAIDLEACTGCSACIVACQVENNIPVVGKDEVARNREMHWIRVDRYYSRSEDKTDVAFQPMMCAQCDHAPCETVCPVLATVHSSEGLNQQIYNRCVGTRYCANNCPYKVRRFNWFDYAFQDPVANLVLNPNVTVRSRGVMEKCTFCVQRIQEAKLEARSAGEELGDGQIQTACQQSCPSQAIVFGDMNDPESRISQLKESPRAFRVLEELNIRPSVTYLALVRNRAEEKEGDETHG